MLRTLRPGAATAALAAAVAAAALPAADARAEPFAFDKAHTQVYFSVDHFGFSRTQGLFREFDGSLDLDRERPERSRVAFTVKTASVDTQWAQRDDHLKSRDFLNVGAFPTMTFASTRVEPTGEGTAKVHGDLTLLGVTKPVTLDVTLNKLADSPITNKPSAGFTAEAVVQRSLWGMTTYVPAIGDEVRVLIEAEAAPAT